VRSDCLCAFEVAAIQQISRNACRAEGMAVRRLSEAGGGAAPFDHAEGVDPAEAVLPQTALLRHGAKQRSLHGIAERRQVLIQKFFRLVEEKTRNEF